MKYPDDFINKIICGDCLEIMKELPNESIDMILCDLPYGTTHCKWDIILPFKLLWKQYKRIIKKNSSIVLTASQPFTSLLIMSNIKMFKYEWIWNKNKAGNIMLVKKQPLKIHENIIVFNGGNYNPQKTNIVGKIRDQRKEKEQINRIDGAATPRGKIKYAADYDPSKRYPVSIQYFPNHREKERVYHPTQKPVELFKYLIKTYTCEKNLVLDNCIGSGTTGIACKQLDRQYIGIEKEIQYCNIAKDRINICKKEKICIDGLKRWIK